MKLVIEKSSPHTLGEERYLAFVLELPRTLGQWSLGPGETELFGAEDVPEVEGHWGENLRRRTENDGSFTLEHKLVVQNGAAKECPGYLVWQQLCRAMNARFGKPKRKTRSRQVFSLSTLSASITYDEDWLGIGRVEILRTMVTGTEPTDGAPRLQEASTDAPEILSLPKELKRHLDTLAGDSSDRGIA